MQIKTLFVILLSSNLISCSENKQEEAIIDVSSIQITDSNGVPQGTTGNVSGQWTSKIFTTTEMALFISLDTANLSKTIVATNIQQYPAYPNPFQNEISTNINTTPPLVGDIVVKYVIVNAKLQPIFKKSKRLSSTLSFRVSDAITKGNYRLYFTFSATDNPHFYKSWGNIQKQ